MLSKRTLPSSLQRRFNSLQLRLQPNSNRRAVYYVLLCSILVIGLIIALSVVVESSASHNKTLTSSSKNTKRLRTNHHVQPSVKDSNVVAPPPPPPPPPSPSAACRDFDLYGNRSAASYVNSIFNCGSVHGLCTWYYPARFFHNSCGPGKQYIHWLSYMEEQRRAKTLWPGGMPPIVLPWVSLSPQLKPKFRSDPFPLHNISMIHVHKTGGTSMVVAFDELKQLGAPMERHTSYQQPISEPRASILYNRTSILLDGAIKYSEHMGSTDHTLIAVVRDPAQRFISAIGQAMGGQGSHTHIASELRKSCLKNTARDTLTCCVQKIKTDGFWFEVHFTPMVLEISFASLFKDIPIAIFPFSAVPKIMYELDQNPTIKRKDGSLPGYRKDPILTKMTLDDYDERTLQDLCDLYRVDTLFLQYLGHESTCDKYTLLSPS